MHQDISKQYTMWCHFCHNWEQACAMSIPEFVRFMKLGGWRLVGGRWTCKVCFPVLKEK